MSESVVVFDPTAQLEEARQAEGRPQKTIPDLRGAVVGFIDNTKPNFSYLVDDLGELLVSKYGARRVIKRKKRAASMSAPAEIFAELAAQCDLVIAGSGD